MGSVACWKPVNAEHINKIHCIKDGSSRGFYQRKSLKKLGKIFPNFSSYPFYLKVTHFAPVDPNKRTYITGKTKS